MRSAKLLSVARAVLIATAMLVSAGCGHMPSKAQASSPDASTATNDSVNEGASGLPFSNRASATSSAGTARASALVPNSLTLPAGTAVSIRLQSAVSSATARPGDSFEAVLDEPLVIDGHTVAQRGAVAVGRIVQTRSSGRLQDSGYLRLTLASININGKQVPVQASSVLIQGGAHKKRNLALIGGGTGAGTLIGGTVGGGKGALMGVPIGAGGGTGAAYATGEKDVGFGPERRLTFRLTQPLVAG